jgi:hypothetical protein
MNQNTVTQLVIEDLASENVLLNERIASLEADNRTLHELAVAGFDALRTSTLTLQKLRGQHAELKDEYRQFRERILIGDVRVRTTTNLPVSIPRNIGRQDEGAPCH